jgi:hypothetical protein
MRCQSVHHRVVTRVVCRLSGENRAPRTLVAACAVICSLMLPELWRVPGAAVAGASGVQVRANFRSFEVTLGLARAVFPRGALVRATLRLHNLSTRALLLEPAPRVSVVGAGGNEVYSSAQGSYPQIFPGVGGFKPPTGFSPSPPASIQAGATRVFHIFLVLRGSRLRSTITVFTPKRSNPSVGTGVLFTTPLLSVRLFRGAAPLLSISFRAPEALVQVRPTQASQRGNLWYMQVARCGQTASGTPDWTAVAPRPSHTYRVSAMCSPLSGWHVAAAWLNQPVGILNYVATARMGTSSQLRPLAH